MSWTFKQFGAANVSFVKMHIRENQNIDLFEIEEEDRNLIENW